MDYSQPAAVYRLYDTAGVLLYTGLTRNPKQRWKDHRKEMLWWPEVAVKRLTWYDTRTEAGEAEQRAVNAEGPRYNKNRTAPAVLPPGVPPQPHGARIAYQQPAQRAAHRLAWFTWRAQLRDAELNAEERAAVGRG